MSSNWFRWLSWEIAILGDSNRTRALALCRSKRLDELYSSDNEKKNNEYNGVEKQKNILTDSSFSRHSNSVFKKLLRQFSFVSFLMREIRLHVIVTLHASNSFWKLYFMLNRALFFFFFFFTLNDDNNSHCQQITGQQ